MTLAKVPRSIETVDVGGALFDLRAISRAEAATFQKMQEADRPKDELEIAVIAAATDTPADEVREWYGATDGWAVEELIGHIKRISRFDEGAQKSSGTGDSTGG